MQENHEWQPEQPESAVPASNSEQGSEQISSDNRRAGEAHQSTASKLSFGKSRGVKATSNKTGNVAAPSISPKTTPKQVSNPPVQPSDPVPAHQNIGQSAREQAIAAMLGNSSVLKAAPVSSDPDFNANAGVSAVNGGFVAESSFSTSSNAYPSGLDSCAAIAVTEGIALAERITATTDAIVMEQHSPSSNNALQVPSISTQRNTAVKPSDENLARTKALLDGISADALATSARQRRYLIYISTAVVLVGAIIYVVASSLPQLQLLRPPGWLLLFVPICVALTLKETSRKLARRDPVMAQRLCKWLAFGNPVALSHLSYMYADVGNYAKAEKLLVAACKTVPVKNVGIHIVMHANLAAARARSGSIPAAESMLQESLDGAKNLKSVRPVPSSSVVLATALYYAAEIKAQKHEFQSARELLTQAFDQLAGVKSPPVEVLVGVLSLLGRTCTILGNDAESLLYLEKAKEIADKIDALSFSQTAEVFANLGRALYRVGDNEAGDAAFAQSLNLAQNPSGAKALPAVHLAIASMLRERGLFEESRQAYENAMTACKVQEPKCSHELVNMQSDYATLLRQLGKEGEAAAIDLSAIQGRYSLDQTNTEDSTKKKQQVKPAAVQQQIKKKSRFPIFCLLITLFYGSSVVLEGVRVAPFHSWAWFIGFATVVAIKLRAKYGKQSFSDHPGALIAVLSHLPFARYIVPELATLPQRTVFVFLGCALAIVGILKVALPAPDTVPTGLTSFEYLQLGTMELGKESFNKSRDALEKASKSNDFFGHIAEKMIKSSLPIAVQSDDAINMNMEALKLKKHKDQAEKVWQDCIAKYPNFETPYVHLAQTYMKDVKNKDNLKKADDMAARALKINPKNSNALIYMVKIKKAEGDKEGEQTYLAKMSATQRKVFEKLDGALEGLQKQAEEKSSADDAAEE